MASPGDNIKPQFALDEKAQDVEKSSTERHQIEEAQPVVVADKLARKLSARQVQMIAIAGTIGTGLFLGSGKSLATGGPGSMLLSYSIVGAIVFVTMLSLGEMASFMPIAGSFCTYAGRFVDDSVGFALTWIYWFNDAIATAADLVALQLLLTYWSTGMPAWAFSLIFLFILIALNIVSVRVYGEMEYWMSILKVATIIVFIILGIAVNCGANTNREYIGGKYWNMGEAPFVGGIGGFASVFVTASFAYGGTESIAITAGETRNPTRNLPRVIRNVFWRILIFYILAVLVIGLNVPYNYPNLASKNTRTSPFTIVFQMVGSKVAGSFINAVIMTSVISAGNHALFAGARLLYTLAVDRHAPAFFGLLTRRKVPWVAVLATSALSGLCFGASYIGAGQLWTWMQNIVGVSNQLSWVFIGVASLRFRRAIDAQGLTHLLPFKNWTYPYGPILSIILNSVLILVQGWSSFSPRFKGVDFVSFYVQLPIMAGLYVLWKVLKKTKWVKIEEMDLVTDRWDGGRFGPGSGSEATLAAARGDDWRDETTWTGTSRKKPFWKLPWSEKAKRAGQWLFL
ncbi:Basic amino-acid permease [Ophidiomyces ophidiicola]|nr:Basic amino-acid permease [Ophidiomyces ophidiicola]KAI1910985.1 Basic amino-acid permease [Ophidiomyces ophidiicola]KAI1915525.1 Basic amino-acid permease [Ophidiomyces ophidiicola]KAI1950498.1 Basic amino-acid permease [Ophidiomyces ophidiicola]KAI1951468.1 Basic amino-acid permease [Ophidiomyces ophidiicola]KAI1972419.1 Basic amino-acid permease [Ophidiomyces ophidiicola]